MGLKLAKPLAIAVSAAVWLVIASPASAVPVVDGHFKTAPFDTNSKIVAGPDGNMWLAINGGGKDVAKITPAGQVEEFELEGVSVPSGIAVGPEGKLWVTQGGGVAEFLPSDPKGTSKAIPIADVKAPASIVTGPDKQMWVASEGKVVHFLPSKPEEAKSIPVANLSPKDIDVAGSLLVIADSGNKRVVTMTTAGVATDVPLLGSTSTSQGVAGSPSGQFAFAKSDGTEGLGLVTPPGAPTAVEMPGDPFGVALGSDGAYWFAMSAAESLQRLTPDGKATPLGGFPPKFFPRQIAPGPNNTLWVTMEIPGENVYEVARVSGLEPPVVPISGGKPKAPPETKIVKGPKGKIKTRGKRAKVKFRFSSTTAGVTFECANVKVRKGKKATKPSFRPCRSPKTLNLKPGRYRFSVRAAISGIADPSPATQGFRVVHVR